MGRTKTFAGYIRDYQKLTRAFRSKEKQYTPLINKQLEFNTYNRDMSPYQFEVFMADLFRKLRYTNVKVTNFSRDGGKDIIMEQENKNKRVLVLVECKYQKALIGRPIIQKLHSALSMYKYRGEKKGIIVTTGYFSDEAIEYAGEINKRDKNISKIELIDKDKLNSLIKKVGQGILKDKTPSKITLSYPYSNKKEIIKTLNEIYFDRIKNFNKNLIKITSITLVFNPIFMLNYKIDKIFKTSVGAIYHVDKDGFVSINSSNGEDLDENLSDILGGKPRDINQVEGVKINIEKPKLSELRLKTQCLNRLISDYSKNVTYYGKNGVAYQKECEIDTRDIEILDMHSANIPLWDIQFLFNNKKYRISFYEGQKEVYKIENNFCKCFDCSEDEQDLFSCNKCNKIFCKNHAYLCKNCGKPICHKCSVNKTSWLIFTSHFCSQKCLDRYNKK